MTVSTRFHKIFEIFRFVIFIGFFFLFEIPFFFKNRNVFLNFTPLCEFDLVLIGPLWWHYCIPLVVYGVICMFLKVFSSSFGSQLSQECRCRIGTLCAYSHYRAFLLLLLLLLLIALERIIVTFVSQLLFIFFWNISSISPLE